MIHSIKAEVAMEVISKGEIKKPFRDERLFFFSRALAKSDNCS
jgi:hypothetical protein